LAAIEVEDLQKSFGTVRALAGISFTVADGETVAVLGPNGAGKTTAMEILEGYQRPDGGRARVLGMDPATGRSEFRQRIGIVLQEAGVDAYLSVREVVTRYAELYRRPRDVREVVHLVGLDEKAEARAQSLSGGQKRRLDLALGLVGDPELLFLDEPTTGFDPSARRAAWETVENLKELGKTILLTTHYMDEAQRLADRIVVIAAGRIAADGPPGSIGGREQAAARIMFRLPAGISAAVLPVQAVAGPDGEVLVETSEPTRVLHVVTGWALDRGIELVGLTIARPSLEDVYLALTAETAAEAVGEGG
jgi:ABC-2 type transport system ATP-binding protein